jgi:serine phosphatase RsbU (regulator of sigma subunit)
VRDTRSRNGTVINATSLKNDERHAIKAGDRIYAGHLTIEVREGSNAVLSFVPDERITREATIVTSLDKVLKKASTEDRARSEDSLNTSRTVQALIRAGQELASHRPLNELFGVILDLALAAMEARRGVIVTCESGGELKVRASKGAGFSISTAVRDRVLREKCSLMISDAQLDEALRQQQSIVSQHVRSMITVPLQTGDRVIGLIYVDNGALVRPFLPEDLDLLTVMANVAAIRIEHARLAEIEQNEKLMELELAQASEIQRKLLPAGPPYLEGYDLAGFNVPCRTVGGDYFDFIPYADGRVALIVGDVSGKGLPAAVLMAGLQARIQMLQQSMPEPDEAVTILNRSLAERASVGRFVTLFYALLDPQKGLLRYANAGHNYPLIVREDGTIHSLSGSGMILGIFPEVTYTAEETTMNPGDLLIVYSDGVTEASNIDDTEFGEDGLAQFALANHSQCCAELTARLVAHVRGWCGRNTFADDFTVLFARRHP